MTADGAKQVTSFLPVTYFVAPPTRLGRAGEPFYRGGEFGRIAGGWGRRCRSWRRRPLEGVGADGRSGMSRPLLSSLPRARLCSRWCCQRAEAVCSCAAPVGRASLGWMPLAARHTAISPMMARFGRLPADAHTGWVSSWLVCLRIRLAMSVTSWDRLARY